jgi:hypothetical protein
MYTEEEENFISQYLKFISGKVDFPRYFSSLKKSKGSEKLKLKNWLNMKVKRFVVCF